MLTRRRPSHGFTLVELLVVVGIVGVLIALLMPALNLAWASARRTACASNIRQLAMGFRMYYQENGQRYPRDAHVGAEESDWIYWQASRNLADSPIARYLNATGPDVFRCPSDDLDAHRVWFYEPDDPPEPYLYSYLFNNRFTESFSFARGTTTRNVPHPDEKLMLIEGDEATIYSGRWDAGVTYLGMAVHQDLLGTRHDPQRCKESFPVGSFPPYGPDRPDRKDRGNAAFADGHVGYVTREYTWDGRNCHPWAP
jgi:prepilin-type N-terminal cleavage/methylation domain-containing protein/prepilin-type processing-associated H-X9-DG protein